MASTYLHSVLQCSPRGRWMLVIHGSHILPISLSAAAQVKPATFHQKISTSVPVLAVAFNSDGSKFAAVLDNKSVALWEEHAQDWRPIGKPFVLPKKPSALTFTPESDSLLIADRFGNVHKFTIKDILSQKTSTSPAAPDSASASTDQQPEQQHEDDDEEDGDGEDDAPSGGKEVEDEAQNIVLGHFGTISDLRFTPNGKFLVSADRDDRIRVSKWPHVYVVQSFCLGHTSFVVKAKPIGATNFLVSGAGDGTVRTWNLLTGAEISKVEIEFKEASESSEATGDEDTSPQKSIVTDLVVDPSSGLVFAAVDGHHGIHVFRVDMKTGKLTRIGDVATGTGVFAMQQDQDGKLWIMGESPRVQILKITVDGATGKLQTKPIDLGEPIAELSKYLEAHAEKHVPALFHLFVDLPVKQPKAKRARKAKD
eukprot:TRINITY_DN3166_c0_g1_i1.p1 TRINITY_DN3166_c0_g1~~TRINITY_DN3166_c0_g1_i1.p1  ORF type:complete len:425 (+),score=125.07 TRINITY_DN3166_c0_g1_i1:2798-4072(+)